MDSTGSSLIQSTNLSIYLINELILVTIFVHAQGQL